MGMPCARVADMHVCPLVNPGAPGPPHVGGPILPPGVPTVLVVSMPVAIMGGMCTCVGPPDSIVLTSLTVKAGNMGVARLNDMTAHGGQIVLGAPTVLVGG